MRVARVARVVRVARSKRSVGVGVLATSIRKKIGDPVVSDSAHAHAHALRKLRACHTMQAQSVPHDASSARATRCKLRACHRVGSELRLIELCIEPFSGYLVGGLSIVKGRTRQVRPTVGRTCRVRQILIPA